jgi:hypothetical protein
MHQERIVSTIVKKGDQIVNTADYQKLELKYKALRVYLLSQSNLENNQRSIQYVTSKLREMYKIAQTNKYDPLIKQLQKEVEKLIEITKQEPKISDIITKFLFQLQHIVGTTEDKMTDTEIQKLEAKRIMRSASLNLSSIDSPSHLYENHAECIDQNDYYNLLLMNENDLTWYLKDRVLKYIFNTNPEAQPLLAKKYENQLIGDYVEQYVFNIIEKKSICSKDSKFIAIHNPPKSSRGDAEKKDMLIVSTENNSVESVQKIQELVDFFSIISHSLFDADCVDQILLHPLLNDPEFNTIKMYTFGLKTALDSFHLKVDDYIKGFPTKEAEKIHERIELGTLQKLKIQEKHLPSELVDQFFKVLTKFQPVIHCIDEKIQLQGGIAINAIQIKSSQDGLIHHNRENKKTGVLFVPRDVQIIKEGNQKKNDISVLQKFNIILTRAIEEMIS